MNQAESSKTRSGKARDGDQEAKKRIAHIIARCSDRMNAGDSVNIEQVLRENPDLLELRQDLEHLLILRSDLQGRKNGYRGGGSRRPRSGAG